MTSVVSYSYSIRSSKKKETITEVCVSRDLQINVLHENCSVHKALVESADMETHRFGCLIGGLES